MNSNSIDQEATEMKPAELSSFGMILAGVIYLGVSWWTWSLFHPVAMLSVVIFLLALVSPKTLKHVYGPWMFLGGKIAHINITIVLSCAYFLLFTPLSWFFKMTGRDVLQLKWWSQDRDSFWEPYDAHESTVERYRRLF